MELNSRTYPSRLVNHQKNRRSALTLATEKGAYAITTCPDQISALPLTEQAISVNLTWLVDTTILFGPEAYFFLTHLGCESVLRSRTQVTGATQQLSTWIQAAISLISQLLLRDQGLYKSLALSVMTVRFYRPATLKQPIVVWPRPK